MCVECSQIAALDAKWRTKGLPFGYFLGFCLWQAIWWKNENIQLLLVAKHHILSCLKFLLPVLFHINSYSNCPFCRRYLLCLFSDISIFTIVSFHLHFLDASYFFHTYLFYCSLFLFIYFPYLSLSLCFPAFPWLSTPAISLCHGWYRRVGILQLGVRGYRYTTVYRYYPHLFKCCWLIPLHFAITCGMKITFFCRPQHCFSVFFCKYYFNAESKYFFPNFFEMQVIRE